MVPRVLAHYPKRMLISGRWSWRLESAEECVTTQLPEWAAPKNGWRPSKCSSLPKPCGYVWTLHSYHIICSIWGVNCSILPVRNNSHVARCRNESMKIVSWDGVKRSNDADLGFRSGYSIGNEQNFNNLCLRTGVGGSVGPESNAKVYGFCLMLVSRRLEVFFLSFFIFFKLLYVATWSSGNCGVPAIGPQRVLSWRKFAKFWMASLFKILERENQVHLCRAPAYDIWQKRFSPHSSMCQNHWRQTGLCTFLGHWRCRRLLRY